MNKTLFDWYKDIKKNLVIAQENKDDLRINEFIQSLNVINESSPGIEEHYERYEKMVKSFSPEQIDFICYQISDWYLTWKSRIVIDEGSGHRLGFAKEALKSMICGD